MAASCSAEAGRAENGASPGARRGGAGGGRRKPLRPVMKTCMRMPPASRRALGGDLLARGERPPPVGEEVGERLLERDARRPAGVGAELRAVADQDLDVR